MGHLMLPDLTVVAQVSAGTTLIQTLTKALALGAVYVMMGLGFVIIFKATQVLNFAAGGLSMAGAMFMSILVADRGLPFLPFDNPLAFSDDPSVPAWFLNLAFALILAAILGLVIERLAIRPMIGQPLFAMAVITLGVEIALGPFNRDATALEGRRLEVPWGAEAWSLGEAQIPKSYVAAIIFALVAGAIVFVFYQSRFGVAMRAVAFDQEAAMAQGINVARVFAIAWALGIALSALAGIAYGMAPFPPGGSVSQEIHPILAFRVLPVIVLGGLDSVKGVLYGGFLIALAEVFSGQYFARWTDVLGPGYSTVVPYIVMLIVLVIRPFGLFGTPEIRRV